VLSLLRLQNVDLAPTRGKGPCVLSPDPEQDKLGRVAEVEADAAAVRLSILADLVPYEICFVFESPGTKDLQALLEECIRYP
jgi:hypothetical protein